MKLIVVSNRLPITVTKDGTDFKYKKTSGGLVTGIESLSKHVNFIWLGNISGKGLSESDKNQISKDCWDKFRSVPVFINPELNDRCYNGFCNAILWPIIHSFPDDVAFKYPEYKAYQEYNKIFTDKILEIAENDDIIWVHDYHLMLVPRMLREVNCSLKIMYFLHTAFTEPSNLKPLVCKDDLLKGICGSDVISFHLPDYAINFSEALKEAGIKTEAKIKAIPIGIDPEMFRNCLKEEETKKIMEMYRTRFKDKKIILGVDRTDYIKGMPQKMMGFKRFLERNPTLSSQVVLLQIAIPSRLDVVEYSAYVETTNEIVSGTNGSIGSIASTPIHFLFNSVNFKELCALYAISECILITSVMDGMNLVALEYVACQNLNKGVVILSKFAGALSTLQGSISFNPNNTEEVAEKIEEALRLDPVERSERHEKNKRNIDVFTSVRWAEDNLEQVYKGWRDQIQVDKK